MKKLLLCFLLTIAFTAKAQNLIPFKSEGKIGFKDTTGKVVIEPNYKYPDNFHDGLLSAVIDKKKGYVDITGKIVIPFIYENTTNFYKGFAAVQLNKTVFIIDKTGKQIKKLKYNSLTFSSKDVANVGLDGKEGRIEIMTGKEIIPPIYDYIHRFGINLIAKVRQGQKWGVINKAGGVIVPIQYDGINMLNNNIYKVQVSEKYGVVDLDLKLIPELKYDYMEDYPDDEGFIMVKTAGKCGFLNNLGKELTPLKYDFVRKFTEGYATVFREGRWYFLNKSGEEFPIVYNGKENFENVSGLMNGFCMVKFKGKKGFIDKNTKLVVPLLYDDTGLYHYGLVKVKLNNKWGVIDESGNIIIPIENDTMDIYYENITATKNGKELYFDKTGKPIAKPKE